MRKVHQKSIVGEFFYLCEDVIGIALDFQELAYADAASNDNSYYYPRHYTLQFFALIQVHRFVDEPTEEHNDERDADKLNPVGIKLFHPQCVLACFYQVAVNELLWVEMAVDVVVVSQS